MIQKKAIYKKFDQEFMEISKFPFSLSSDYDKISSNITYYSKGKIYKPIGEVKLNFGYDNDDFIKNLVTVVASRFIRVNKVSRIFKQIYPVKDDRKRFFIHRRALQKSKEPQKRN